MAIELPGQVFGEWTVLEDRGRSGGHAMVLARCSCGTEKVVRLKHLTSGASHSCHGFGSTVRTHGHASGSRHDTNRTTPEYNAWKMMRQRCSNPKNPNYKNYGARGIRVCEEWDRSFEAFLRDMGPRPSPDLSIDRINNDGNYEPGNCRWATDHQQQTNRGNNLLRSAFGEQKTLREWAEDSRCVVSFAALKTRVIRRRVDLQTAMTIPWQRGVAIAAR